MESYGEILKNTRESKNIDIDAVVSQTTISRKYIEALENEKDSDFPGEPYFIGFLKNYCEYLGIESAELLKLYHAKKIQEAPVPVQLLEKKRSKYLVPVIVLSSAMAFIITAVCVSVFVLIPKYKAKKAEELAYINTPTTYVINYELSAEEIETAFGSEKYSVISPVETLNKRVYKGDQIVIAKKDGDIRLVVSDTLGKLVIKTPSGSQVISLTEERLLDVDGDGRSELVIYLSEIDNNNEKNGAEIRLFTKDENLLSASETDINEIETVQTALLNTPRQKVIHESNRAYPFSVEVSFRGPCLFRYSPDRQDYIENFYKSGEQVSQTTNNGIRLWMSNSNALAIKVVADTSRIDLPVGAAGAVSVEEIKWVRDTDGKYKLVVVTLD